MKMFFKGNNYNFEMIYKEFNKNAKSFLTGENYLKYLENKLDEDRSHGEWENAEE